MPTGTQIKPRPVFCIVEHAYRDRTVAEQVCAGQFSQNGVTLELGLDPNWMLAGLREDEEWRIAWSKFYFGLNLASAYAETGERRFQHAWERLVDSWIRRVPIDFDPTDAIGRRIQNWIYAWSMFARAPQFNGFSDGLAEKIVASLAEQTRYLRNHLTAERNHRTLELYALFIVALALPEAAADDLLEFAITALYDNLLSDVRPDGVHREQSTHYHMVTLRSFLAARENARRFGLSFPSDYDARLERACEFALHCHRPDGSIPALSDADTGSYSDLLQLASSLLSRPDFLYATSAGAQGKPPQQRYASFPDAGYYIQRSGWGEGATPFTHERFLIFDCGPIGDGGHGHYDLLSVEIAGGGRPLIVDPGRYTYAEYEPNMRRWFKGTVAHNTVCVDGFDQTPYRRGKPRPPLAQARLLERYSAPGFDMLSGAAESPCYEVIHTRRIFFVADEYWVVHDHLVGNRPHRFDLRFHLSPEAWNQTKIQTGANGAMVCAPGVCLIFPAGQQPNLESGWVAPRYGVKLPAPVVSVVADGFASAEFFSLVVPTDNPEHIPSLEVHRGEAPGAFAVRVRGVGANHSATDRVQWSVSSIDNEVGSFQCRASAFWWRWERQSASTVLACNVQELRWKHSGQAKPLASIPSPWVRWDERGSLFESRGEAL